MNEIVKANKLKLKLNELKKLTDSKDLYLITYFNKIRDEIDKEFKKRLFNELIPDEKQSIINQWNQMNNKINQLEDELIKHELRKEFSKETIDELDAIQTKMKYSDFNLIAQLIENVEEKIEKNFFQNKAIKYISMKDNLNNSCKNYIDGKLFILNDEYISDKYLKEIRSLKFFNFLSIDMIKSIELEKKLNTKDCIIEESFNFENIKQLFLSTKQIIEIKEDTFKHFKSLEFLDLSLNKINDLNKIFCEQLSNLRHLNLSNNQIHHLSGKSFEKSIKLVCLYLTENKISNVERLDFFVGLKKLNMCANFISDLDCFVNMNCLEELYLNKNKITVVKFNSFNGLKNLKILDLEENKIGVVEKKAFANLESLIFLNLSRNQISYVNEEVFQGLNKLDRLDLQSNEISILNSMDYKLLVNLKEINLFNNKIKRKTQANLVKEMTKLKKKGVSIILPVRMKKKITRK